MTYGERMNQLCTECRDNATCGYIERGLQRKCRTIELCMYGWELGQEDTIEAIESLIVEGEPWPLIGDNIKRTIEHLKSV